VSGSFLFSVSAFADLKSYQQRKAREFVEAKSKEEGVVTLPSGLRYKVLKSGSGTESPSASDKVTVHYRGSLIDGSEFDSSYSRNAPATFTVSGLIKGWTEALQLMHEGDSWELYIPPELGYGERGAGRIPGNAPLVFSLELISIGNKPKPANPTPKTTEEKEEDL